MTRWLVMAILLAGFGVRAQGDTDVEGWRLKTPTAAEYLAAMPEIGRVYNSEIGDTYALREFYKTFELEIASSHPDSYTQNYDAIERAYQTLNVFYSEGVNQVFWHNALVLSLLNAGHINLDLTQELHLKDFNIQITGVDFDGDGQHEWILDVDEPDTYHSYLVTQRINNIYYPVTTPLPAIKLHNEFGDMPAGTLSSLKIDDLNGDGSPEWAVVLDYVGEYNDSGRLYILIWRDGALIDIGEAGMSFMQPSTERLPITWKFLNLDSDSSLEVEQHRQVEDNWDCEWTEITIFDWDEQQFIKNTSRQEFPESEGCIRRRAETAMWEDDYETAIALYEKLPHTADLTDEQVSKRVGSFPTMGALSNYTDIRLAIAYILDGQLTKGITLFQSLKQLPAAKFKLSNYLDAMLQAYAANPTDAGLCMASYDFILYKGYYFWDAANLEVGYTVDNQLYDQGMYIPGPASPTSAACDAPALIAKIIRNHTFKTSDKPTDELAELGISTGYSVSFDLDHDGQPEWLIWPSIIQVSPIFFAAGRDAFLISRPAVSDYPPDEYNQIAVTALPNDSGTALINLDFSKHYEQTHAGFGLGGGPGCPSFGERDAAIRLPDQPGRFSLWHFEDHTLSFMLDAPVCKLTTPEDIILVQSGTPTLAVWTFDDYQGYIPATYTWDDELKNYVPPPALATPTPAVAVQTYTRSNYDLALMAQNAYAAGDYSKVSQISAVAQAPERGTDDLGSVQLQYYRALALEALGRDDAALAEYVSIYEGAPESAWGMLAALHFEVARDE